MVTKNNPNIDIDQEFIFSRQKTEKRKFEIDDKSLATENQEELFLQTIFQPGSAEHSLADATMASINPVLSNINGVITSKPELTDSPSDNQSQKAEISFSGTQQSGSFSIPEQPLNSGLSFTATTAPRSNHYSFPEHDNQSQNIAEIKTEFAPFNQQQSTAGLTEQTVGQNQTEIYLTPKNDNAINHAPSVHDADLGAMKEDTEIKFEARALLENASDADGDTLSVVDVSVDEKFGSVEFSTDRNGNIETIKFTPAEDFNGEDVPLNFVVSDGQVKVEGTAQIDVTAVNDAPVVGQVDLGAMKENTEIKFEAKALLENASDADGDKLSVVDVSVDEKFGSVEFSTDRNGNIETIKFIPAEDFHGEDVPLKFVVSDGKIKTEGLAVIDIKDDNVNNIIKGTVNDDKIYSSEDNDTINADAGNDYISSGGGNDIISGGSGRNYIVAGDGDDTVIITEGDGRRAYEVVRGGDGSDTVIFSGDRADYTVTHEDNNSRFVMRNIQSGEANYIYDDVETIQFKDAKFDTFTDGKPTPDLVNDVVSGTDAHINAGSGDDVVTLAEGEGHTGHQVIRGGDGSDTVIFSGDRGDYTVDHEARNGRFRLTNIETGEANYIYDDVETIQFKDAKFDAFTDGHPSLDLINDTFSGIDQTFTSIEKGTEIISDSFDSNDGWSNNAISDGELTLTKENDNTTNTFDVGIENAGKTVNVSFDAKALGTWDNTENAYQDTFTVNGQEVTLERYAESKSFQIEIDVDDKGLINLEFNGSITGSDEGVVIDNLSIITSNDDWLESNVTSGPLNDYFSGGSGSDTYLFGDNSGHDTFNGGQGWTDTIHLDASNSPNPDAPWTITVEGQEITVANDTNVLDFGEDTSGVVTMADGSALTFEGVERIEW